MGSNQFCLRWNNHQNNLLTVFDDLLSTELFVDVTLACEGTSLKAHKVVLSACSSFFQDLFKDNPCKHPIVILKDVRYVDLKAIIKFMYKGEVNISQDQLPPLLKAADALRVKGLVEITQDQQQQVLGDAGNEAPNQQEVRPPERQPGPPPLAAAPADSFIMTPQLIPMIFQPTQPLKKPIKILERRICPATTTTTAIISSNAEPVQTIAMGLKTPNQVPTSNATSSESPVPKSSEPLLLPRIPEMQIKGELIDSPNSANDEGANTDSEYPADNFPVFPDSDINNTQPAFRISMTNDGIPVQTRDGDMISTEAMDQLNTASTSEYTQETSENYHSEDNIPLYKRQYTQDIGESSCSEDNVPSYNRLFSLTQPSSKLFKCPICKKMFNQRYNMKKHLTHFHAPLHVRHHCLVCPKSFRWKEDLNKHMDKQHDRRKRFQCVHCSLYFHHHWRLEQHTLKFHSDETSEEKESCDKKPDCWVLPVDVVKTDS